MDGLALIHIYIYSIQYIHRWHPEKNTLSYIYIYHNILQYTDFSDFELIHITFLDACNILTHHIRRSSLLRKALGRADSARFHSSAFGAWGGPPSASREGRGQWQPKGRPVVVVAVKALEQRYGRVATGRLQICVDIIFPLTQSALMKRYEKVTKTICSSKCPSL